MIDYKKWLLFLCIGTVVVLILASCTTSKKAVNISKVHSDSTVSESNTGNKSVSTDSISTILKSATSIKETNITYTPVEVDSSVMIADSFIVIKSSKGKKIVFVPHINIKETGTKNKQQDVHLQKKDTSSQQEVKQVEVKKDEKTVSKQKFKVGFNLWWLLLLIPAPLLFKKVRLFIKKLIFV
jgi:hypothetical protein